MGIEIRSVGNQGLGCGRGCLQKDTRRNFGSDKTVPHLDYGGAIAGICAFVKT